MRHATVLLAIVLAALMLGRAAMVVAQDAKAPPPFVYDLTAEEAACIAEATGSPPHAWLGDMVSGIIRGCRDQVHAKRLGALGISATGLTEEELAVIVAGRAAKAATRTAATATGTADPTTTSGTARPR